jgi:hypothetical protein
MEAMAVGVEEADLKQLHEMLRKFTIEEEFCLRFHASTSSFSKESMVHGLNVCLMRSMFHILA